MFKIRVQNSNGFLDVINLSTDQQAFLKDIPDAMFRETTRDFMVNQQFRKDYWVKGARTMTPLDQAEALRSQRVILTTPRADAGLKVTGSLGEATLHENVYVPILDALADHKVKSLAQLEAEMQKAKTASIPTVIVIDTDPMPGTGAGGTWWDVAVPEVSTRKEVNEARAGYENATRRQWLVN